MIVISGFNSLYFFIISISTLDKHIILQFPDAQAKELTVNYSEEELHDYYIIKCQVKCEPPKPSWLQLSKFIFTSIKTDGLYSLLFEERKYNKNLQTLLFMDEVYTTIMRKSNYGVKG